MTKTPFMDIAFHYDTLRQIVLMDAIAKKYSAMGYRLTVRQMYYQLLSTGHTTSSPKSYKTIQRNIKNARLVGRIDWDAIEDRARVPIMHSEFDTLDEFIGRAIGSYRTRRWADQRHYVEVMVEKEALAAILEPVANKYHVLLLANKGYSSISAVFDAAKRFKHWSKRGKTCHILYMGDHDPSGLDMPRAIKEQLSLFRCALEVERIALTMEQIKEYKLQSYLAKKKDPRFPQYSEDFGNECWELDALDPPKLTGILKKNILKYLDLEKYKRKIEGEKYEKDTLVYASSRPPEDP